MKEIKNKDVVYILKCDQYCKIGSAGVLLRDRINGFRLNNPFPMKVVLLIEGYTELETYLHKKYDNKWFRNEWFMLSEEDIEYLINRYHMSRMLKDRLNIINEKINAPGHIGHKKWKQLQW